MNRRQSYPHYQRKNQQGFVYVASLIVIPVLLLLGGVAATVSQALATKTQLANSAETSALFLSLRDGDNSANDLNATQVIISHFSSLSAITNKDIKVTKLEQGYQVNASLETPMYLLNTDENTIEMAVNSFIKAENEVSIQKIEMSLVLDYSGSMYGEERTMGTTLAQISQLFSAKNGKFLNMKLAAAPFSSGVTTQINGYLNTRCYKKNNTRWSETYLDWPLLLEQIEPMLEQYDQYCYSTPKVSRLILTDDVGDIETMISQASADYSTNGGTEIDQGLLWGLRLLSPAWQEYDADNQPAPFDSSTDPETKKILFLMTDAAASGNWCHLIDNGSGNCANQIPLCEYAKELGVRIVTMYFETSSWGNNTQEQENLRSCSSGGANDHYLATNSDEVIEQFKKILDGIYSNQLRLVK
ncbi:MAG: hypothetical protein HRU24_18525 [Gammaproteobacteria bacterium]|nr:hypothetical protein [Gammaproteobacteria bacterium]